MLLIKRMMTISLSIIFTINLSACFMMPLMFGTSHDTSMSDNEDPKVDAAVKELIEESVGVLDGDRGLDDTRLTIGS